MIELKSAIEITTVSAHGAHKWSLIVFWLLFLNRAFY